MGFRMSAPAHKHAQAQAVHETLAFFFRPLDYGSSRHDAKNGVVPPDTATLAEAVLSSR